MMKLSFEKKQKDSNFEIMQIGKGWFYTLNVQD